MPKRQVLKRISQFSKENLTKAKMKGYVQAADKKLLDMKLIKKVNPEENLGISRRVAVPTTVGMGIGVTAGMIAGRPSRQEETIEPYVHPMQQAPAFQHVYGPPQMSRSNNLGATGDINFALHNLRHG